MSTRYNFFGGLVTDGLVLNLDAAKLQSYPGSGTNWVNLINNPISGGTLYNGASITGSGKNLAITFDGTNDYTEVLDNSIIDFGTSNFTSNIWIYPSSSLIGNTEYGIINKNNGFQNVTGWGLELSTYDYSTPFPKVDMLGFNSGQSSWGLSTILAPIRTNTWSNVNLMRTGNKFDLYVNGSLSATKINSNVGLNVDNSVNLTLGKSSTWQQYFKGNISNFNLFNRALSPFDIFQNFNAYKSRYGIPDIVTSGLTLNLDAGNPYSYSPLNTGSTTWTDVSGNGNDGTLTNGASYTGGTIFLDGTDDYVNCGTGSTLTFNNGTNLNDIPFTIGVWVKFNSVSGYQLVIAKSDYGSSPNKREFLFFTNADSRIHINLMNSDNYNNRIGRYYNTVLSTNTWYHMFATYDGSKLESGLKIYINGVRVDDTSDSVGTYSGLSRTTTPFSFGTDWNNYPNQGNKLSGYYGLGQVYRRELSAGEIAQNFNATRGRYGI
jgi:hypothetical protein